MTQNNQERFKENMEILWSMVRTNELYTFDMFYNDLKGKIFEVIGLNVGCWRDRTSYHQDTQKM